MDSKNYTTFNTDQESGEPTEEKATVQGIETHLPVLEDVNHPRVPENSHDYILRQMPGNISDIELISFVLEDEDYYVLLEGEAGVGKNMSVSMLAEAANWPMVRVNFGAGTTYDSLVGRYAPVDREETEGETLDRVEAVRNTAQRFFEENENMEMEKAVELASHAIPDGSSFAWRDGILTRAVKNGWIFVGDEMNAANDSAIMPLNGLLEGRDERYLTIEEKSEVIEPHPRFRFVATRNPATYGGAGEMNSALESRGYIIQYDYHEQEALKSILKKRTNIVENESEEAVDQLTQLVEDIRRQEQAHGDIMTKIASRDCIKICRLTDIMPIRNACENVMLGIADPTDEQAIHDMIDTCNFN